ncbi:MAG TPA: GNAT family N-acetyltransferase [Candidatus Limnocylindria bacterium]|nr:GNAT family N-acetyltransferase [Candidatus Limnocylindria bacterium]
MRERQRVELNCQIVHDSIHRREGWTRSYRLRTGGVTAGFGSVAIAGPWQDKPTVFEFYLLPEYRARAFHFYETFLAASGARFFEVQSNDLLLTALTLTHARDIESEKIVFQDQSITSFPPNGATLRCLTPEDEIRAAIERRQCGGEWVLELDGVPVASGGILFHYNRPYGDIYMDVAEPFRRRGWGAYLVQELKRACYELGAVPAARCNLTNIPSRRTLQRAGFVSYAHILIGPISLEHQS